MKWKFEQEFRKDKPETIGETDIHFDLDNYKDWLEGQLSEARSKLHQPAVISAVCEHTKGSCKIVDKKHTMKCDDCGEIIWQTDL